MQDLNPHLKAYKTHALPIKLMKPCTQLGSNQRPSAYQTDALPLSYKCIEGSRTRTSNYDFGDHCFTF